MIKFPSIHSLLQGAAGVLKRFPVEVLFALTATVAATVNVELNDVNYHGQGWCWRIIAGANLGLLLSLSATLYGESKQWPLAKIWILRLAAVLVTVGIFLSIDPFTRSTDAIRFFLLSFAFHLLVSFAAFSGRGNLHGFWQFNKTLFLRFLTSALYSAVLFAGLAAAIGAANFLFNLKFEWDTFANLWVWIVGMFSVIFFLAGVPVHTASLEQDDSYPKGLKIFTQYVLIPLATVYVVILLAYEAKIIVQWQLPKGLVSSLVLGYAVFGILSILLVYPIRNLEGSRWIKSYAKSFYLLLLPLIVLLFVATGARVFKYGVTELRYFLIVLAFWLLFISVYFLASARQSIKLIPMSLCLLSLLAVYGPLSAFSVAKVSQLRILKEVFARNHALKDGKLQKVSDKISKRDGNRAVAVINYLVERHDLASLQPYFKQDLDHVADSIMHLKGHGRYDERMSRYEARGNKIDWVKKQLNLEDFSGYDYDDERNGTTEIKPLSKQYILNTRQQEVVDVSGYDQLINVSFNSINDLTDSITVDTSTYELPHGKMSTIRIRNSANVTVELDGQKISFDLNAWSNTLLKDSKQLKSYRQPSNSDAYYQYDLPAQLTSITKYTGKHKVTFRVDQLNVSEANGVKKADVNYCSGVFLIKW
ncbi:DUF4153 domain-containing protein [Mucilaginibacter daejeonensis]|uniref:DUF4153 domain-containing protein n=1 Tax=Mucilaginibacter daejeonensis TaxID=398049 RepID=UPI001D179892|nr:DUF4153 domain-containing protein [Mucilaginibacter daejeonensis]UEG53747.1 DUF4153 domain-containing protein [Mucilaginibacter daejeonensis]